VSTLSKIPAALNLVATVGSDFILGVTVLDNGDPYDFTSSTIETAILTGDGVVVPVNFVTSTVGNQLTLTLSDEATTALGVDSWFYELRVTDNGVTSPWLAGTLAISPRGLGGPSATSGSLSITPQPAVTLDLTIGVGIVGPTGPTGPPNLVTVLADFVTPYSYIGVAVSGASTAQNVWDISRIDVGPPVVVQTAQAVAWDNRLVVPYS